jgi:hypothetical protein
MLVAEVVCGKPATRVCQLRRDSREQYWYCEGTGATRRCADRRDGMRRLEQARRLLGGQLVFPPVRIVSIEPPLPRSVVAECMISDGDVSLIVGRLERDSECFWLTRLVGAPHPIYDERLALGELDGIAFAYGAKVIWVGVGEVVGEGAA